MPLHPALARQAARRARPSASPTPTLCRCYATPASSATFQYQTGTVGGVKFASRDLPGPTATLALVAKAGTRYQPLPGLAEGLEKYAFRNTNRRSALRLQRESELFGATLFSHHTRESLLIGAKFFRDDLPYFVELLSEVASQTKYLDYEFVEQVMPHIQMDQHTQLAQPAELAQASAHGLAFHRGLGEPLHPTSSAPLGKYLNSDVIGAYSTLAYTRKNVALVANGVAHDGLAKWAGEYTSALNTSSSPNIPPLENEQQTRYYGGEERIAHGSGNAMVLGFPGSSSLTGGFYKPEIAVLAALLGGRSSIKWSPGFTVLSKAAARHYPILEIDTASKIYSDAGLLTITISSPHSVDAVRDAAEDAVAAIKDLAAGKLNSDDFKKAKAFARFAELEHGQGAASGLELTGAGLVRDGKPYQLDESAEKIGKVTEAQVKEAAKSLLEFKVCVSAVGDLWALPYAEELGLSV